MKEEFKKFNENIRLTNEQEDDAKTKVKEVSKKLHSNYYSNEYDGNTKFIFGSYKTKTNVRPLSAMQDVDVLFKIPKETFDKFDSYESNGQSALLDEIKNILKEKYSTIDKISAWGKVVLVKFSENHHNIEVLPAFELDNGKFKIPNTEDGGYWEIFDPRKQVSEFQVSNDKTNGLTSELSRMIKSWIRNTSSLNYSSFQMIDEIMSFLKDEFTSGAEYGEYPEVIKNFYDSLKSNCSEEIGSHVSTAFARAVKAIEYMDDNKPKEASEEWIKIFGELVFPKVKENPQKENNTNKSRTIINPSAPWSE